MPLDDSKAPEAPAAPAQVATQPATIEQKTPNDKDTKPADTTKPEVAPLDQAVCEEDDVGDTPQNLVKIIR